MIDTLQKLKEAVKKLPLVKKDNPYITDYQKVSIIINKTDVIDLRCRGNGDKSLNIIGNMSLYREKVSESLGEGVVDLLKKLDYTSIFREMRLSSNKILERKLPVYWEFLQEIQVVEDAKCSTLYVMYDEILSDYVIHYNPKFVVKMSVLDSVYNNDTEVLDNTYAYLIAHEISHVLNYHMNNQTNMLDNIPHTLSNILCDSFINTKLNYIFKVKDERVGVCPRDLSVGISGGLSFTGKLKPKYKDTSILIKDIIEKLGYNRFKVKLDNYTNDIVLRSDTDIEIIVNTLNEGLNNLYGGNSNLYVRTLADFKDYLLDEVKINGDNMSQDIKRQSGSSSGGSSGSSGDSSGGSSDSSSGGSSGSSGGSSSGGSSGDSSSGDSSDNTGVNPNNSHTIPKEDTIQDIINSIQISMSESEIEQEKNQATSNNNSKKVLNDKINEAVKSANDSNQSDDEKTKKISEADINNQDDMLKAVHADKVIINSMTISSWKSQLRKVLASCLGIDEKYNPNLPSSRVEGQFGRDEDVSSPKEITILIDKSGSMNLSKYKEALTEIETFTKALNIKRIKTNIILWGNDSIYKTTKTTQNLIKFIQGFDKSLGGTNYNTALNEVVKHCKHSDIYVCLTDGEIYGSLTDVNLNMYNKIKKRHIWFILKNGSVSWINSNDNNAKNRIIKQK